MRASSTTAASAPRHGCAARCGCRSTRTWPRCRPSTPMASCMCRCVTASLPDWDPCACTAEGLYSVTLRMHCEISVMLGSVLQQASSEDCPNNMHQHWETFLVHGSKVFNWLTCRQKLTQCARLCFRCPSPTRRRGRVTCRSSDVDLETQRQASIRESGQF